MALIKADGNEEQKADMKAWTEFYASRSVSSGISSMELRQSTELTRRLQEDQDNEEDSIVDSEFQAPSGRRESRPKTPAAVVHEDYFDHPDEPLEEDLYGIAITSLLRDTRRLASSEGRFCLRISRLSATSSLLILNILLQVFLLWQFKRLVTQAAVHGMRVAYHDYQEAMYDPPFDITAYGYKRGRPENFHPERFQNLTRFEREVLCSCPLSQPSYLGAILAIWTFSVIADLRKVFLLWELLLIRAPNVDSLADMLEHDHDEENNEKTMFLVGLPRSMRCVLFFMVFLPRITVDVILVWLGCRWLVATPSFADVLLNAMALEFLLVLKDVFYTAVVPHRDKIETKQMMIKNRRSDDKPSYLGYLGTFAWIAIVVCWVYVYIRHLQQVLPDYNWDIHDVCQSYILHETKV